MSTSLQAEHADRGEPDEDHGAEQPSDRARPEPLEREQSDQDGDRERNDQVRQRRSGDLYPLDRTEDRDRGGDDAVAEEQRRAKDAERHQHRAMSHPAALQQCGQRHDAAVAAVVRAHDEARVLDRHDDHQRPEDQRRDAVDGGWRDVRRSSIRAEDDLLGVQRTGADVAVHDAERAQRQHGPTGVRDDVPIGIGQGLEAPPGGI